MENESEFDNAYLLPGEESNPIWDDLHEFFQDHDDEFLEL